MQVFFQNVLQMSLTASLIALAVMVIRVLFRNAPRWTVCLMWGLVALRLVCPVSLQSDFSLVPPQVATGQLISNVMTVTPMTEDRLNSTPDGIAESIPDGATSFLEDAVVREPSVSAGERVLPVLSWLWIGGMSVMLCYAGYSYFALKRKLREATHLRENIWQSEMADTPFVLGFLRPKIYLPYQISQGDMTSVIAHERAHISRMDHWWKPIGFLLLSIHWFNPVLWLAYILLCRDIESACDEKVIRHMEKGERQAYSAALLRCSIRRRSIAACPLAFGEVGVKKRVKNVMQFRKPGFWLVLIALVVCIVAAVCFLTNPTDVLEYRIDTKIDAHQTEIQCAHNNQRIGILVTVCFESTQGPEEIQLVYGTEKNGIGEELAYRDPITMTVGASTTFWVPADHHYSLVAQSTDGNGGAVTFRITEKNSFFGTQEQTDGITKLTLNDVIRLSQKGNDLSWDDFRDYPHEDIGSGLFVYRFAIDNSFALDIVGGEPRMDAPMGFLLRALDGTDAHIDIREGAVEEFIRHHSGENTVNLVPTDSLNTGIFDRYLYLTIEGEKYRYERQEAMPGGIQAGAQVETVYENTGVGDVYRYTVFSVKGCEDNSMFLVHSEDMDMMWLYRYSPAKAAAPGALQRAKETGYVVMENGDVTCGQEIWQEFLEKTQAGKPANVMLAWYYTLDPERCSAQYYEAYKEDYPSLFFRELRYDGDAFILCGNEDGEAFEKTYQYLMYYPNGLAGTADYNTRRFVLTNDNSVTWEELFYSLASSQLGAAIDHYTVYSDPE